MKPLKLVIGGIRSFSERVEIDFESVSKNGLFGIFGSTGSGKSTILDSVIIALYGDLSGIKTVELVNARRKNAFISLEFEIFDKSIRRRYRVERTFKLKKDGSYGGAIASLYEITGGNTLSLASLTGEVNKKIEEILGLGQNEFTKCIILPQGEFAQFVKAPKAERVKIIEKLFGLERYGELFNAKLKAKKEQVDLELFALNRDLSNYENATKENLDSAKIELENTRKAHLEEDEKLLKIAEYIEENTSYYNLFTKCENDKKELEKLNGKKAEIDKTKVLAKAVDSAKLVLNLNEDLNEKLLEEKRLKEEVKTLTTLIENLKVEKENVDEEFSKLDAMQSEKEQLKQKSDSLISISEEVVDFKTLRREVLTLLKDNYEKSKKIIELKATLQAKIVEEKDLIQKDERLQAQTDVSNAFSFVSDEVLKKEYSKQVDYYFSQSKKLEEFSSGEKSYLYLKDLITARLDEFKTLLSSIEKDGEVDVESVINNFKTLIKQRSEVINSLGSVRGKIQSLKGEILESENALKQSENLYVLKRKKLDELNEKLLKIVGNIDNYDEELTFCMHCINDIESKQNKIRKSRDEINEKFSLAEKQAFEKRTLLTAVINEKEKIEKQISQSFNEQIKSVEDAISVVKQIENLEDLLQKIDEYEKSVTYYEKAVNLAENDLLKVSFNVENYLKKVEEKKLIEQNVSFLKENFIKNQNIVEILSQNFNKRCIIEKDIASVGARAGVLAQLEQAVSRRAFSEFISAEFLSDVALQARKTLLELTSGKYDVVYKDSVESGKDGFYICDNLNGGIERSVASLSGGETFLVSLSLALALSVGIYSRSEKPMEFFFLDEGFGTLDETLVDVVLDSLEKLRNKNFSIGLISHLAEMKSRIDSKIIVTPATETTGSTVTIKAN